MNNISIICNRLTPQNTNYYKTKERINYNILNNYTCDVFQKSLSFSGRVPSQIKLTREQYNISNILSIKEHNIVQSMFDSLPTITQIALLLSTPNKNFKEFNQLTNSYNNCKILSESPLNTSTLKYLNNLEITNFIQLGTNLEKLLFKLNPEDNNLQIKISNIFQNLNISK